MRTLVFIITLVFSTMTNAQSIEVGLWFDDEPNFQEDASDGDAPSYRKCLSDRHALISEIKFE